jgi:hypothetical protein
MSLSDLAVDTGYWYHQVRVAGRAREFAKSRPFGPSPQDWRVEEVVSPVAEQVDRAIDWIDSHHLDPSSARILAVPSYLTHVFWLANDHAEQIVVIDRPEDYGDHVSGVPTPQ